MKKNRVVALLGLLGVFLSSGLKSSGMENSNTCNRNGGNNSSFFSNILNYWPIPTILGGLGLIKEASDSGNKEIGYEDEDVDYSNHKYTQNFFYKTQYGSMLTLTPDDQNWIDRNVILLDQKEGSSYCWHNASMNYIFAPEFINMTGLPKKIKIMTDWGKQQLKKESNRANNFEERLSGAVEVPRKIRQLPDGFENWLDGSEDINVNQGNPFMFNSTVAMNSYNMGKEIEFNGVNIRDLFTNIRKEFAAETDPTSRDGTCLDGSFEGHIAQKVIDPTKGFTFSFMSPAVDFQSGYEVLWFRPKNYYPTCVVVNHFGGGHYTVFYFAYNRNKEVKFCACLDGNEGNYSIGKKGIKILTLQEAIQKIHESTINFTGAKPGSYHVRYSTEDIVNKYYTPEIRI